MREIAICNDDFCNCAIIVSIKQLGDVAMRFRLVAFTDEAAPDLAGQIEAMQENGVELLEIRGVDGQNIDGISATKAKVIRKMLGFSGLAVWSLGSPFGKIGINDDFAPHLDSFKHSLELADILGAKHICLFSFYGTSDIDPVLERLNAFIEAAKGTDIVLCHENEKGIYGDMTAKCLEIYKALPQLRAVFDPANFIQCGQDTIDALAAHAECDRKVILTEMFFFAYFRDIVCYHIASSILIISGNHFREMMLSRIRRKIRLRHCFYYILYVVL